MWITGGKNSNFWGWPGAEWAAGRLASVPSSRYCFQRYPLAAWRVWLAGAGRLAWWLRMTSRPWLANDGCRPLPPPHHGPDPLGTRYDGLYDAPLLGGLSPEYWGGEGKGGRGGE